MNDLIRRKDAIDYFVTNIGVVDADGYAVDDYDERVKAWTERFSGVPSAEPEQKKGKWIGNKYMYYCCSECGHEAYWDAGCTCQRLFDFCPNCGADMRGE